MSNLDKLDPKLKQIVNLIMEYSAGKTPNEAIVFLVTKEQPDNQILMEGVIMGSEKSIASMIDGIFTSGSKDAAILKTVILSEIAQRFIAYNPLLIAPITKILQKDMPVSECDCEICQARNAAKKENVPTPPHVN